MPSPLTKLSQAPPLTLEELLRQIEDRAASIRYAFESAVTNPQAPDPRALSGFADTAAEIERMAQQARERALEVDEPA